MSDLPHVIAGQIGVSEEHIRVVEAWWREHNDGPMPIQWTASMYNQAVDWWNAGVPEEDCFPMMLSPGWFDAPGISDELAEKLNEGREP